MNKKHLIAVCALALCTALCIAAASKWPRAEASGQQAADPGTTDPDTTDPAEPEPGAADPGTPEPGFTPGNILPFRMRSTDFRAQTVRTDGYHDGAQYPRVTVIHSAEELNAYYEANKDLYYMEGFRTACETYDDAYFAERILVIVLVEAGSGSVRYQVSDVALAGVNGSDLAVAIDVLVPEVGTCDMAEWHILIEPEAGLTVKDADHVTVTLRTGMSLMPGGVQEKITEDRAADIAKTAVTVEYDRVTARFDAGTSTWQVNFYREGWVGGDQTVTLDEYGTILGSVYGE